MSNDKILEKVRKLLDRANHPGTPEHERNACIDKADSLMLTHAIDQAMLDATKKGDRRTPVTRTFRAYSEYEFAHKFQTLMAEMAKTLRCRAACAYNGNTTVVGMPDDVDYFEMLWTTIYLNFVSRIFPRWEDSLSFDHNVYNFKKAGYKWPAIKDTARSNNHWVEWPDGGALIRAYKRHAKLVGDEELVGTQRHAAYRESFAEGFVIEICSKLEGMRAKSEEAQHSSGAELALVDVKERVDEVFYEKFPHFRPMTDEELERIQKEDRERRQREAEELQAKLDAMTPAQRRKWDADQERERQRQARASARYWRDYDREQERRYDRSGMSAGKKAGRETDLTGGSGGMGASKRAGELG